MSTEQRLPRILIVQTGTAGGLARTHGDYPDWFRRALGASALDTPVLGAAPELGGEVLSKEALFRARAKGVLVTGSPLSATAARIAPWMEELGESLLRLGEAGVPILGVCFGHQLLGKAAGADVIPNPRGREMGTVQVQVTEAGRKDPLFSWASDGQIDVQATHLDAVHPLPGRATLLASNEACATQAMRLSETVASVQFHPEIEPQTMRALIRSRADRLHAEGIDPEAAVSAVRESPGPLILRAFVEQVRRS